LTFVLDDNIAEVNTRGAGWNASFFNEFSVLASKKNRHQSNWPDGIAILAHGQENGYRQKDRRNGPFAHDSPR